MQPWKMHNLGGRAVRAACVLSALAVLFDASRLHAKLCGDDVQGQDVPCACGDTVVSNVVLTDDPVTSTVCPGDGLIVRAGVASGITIDLSGKTLRGSGQGAGLWVLYGGSGGARLVSSGQVARLEGFRDGVVAQGNDSLALLDSVVVAHSRRDGVRVHGNNYSVHATEVVDSGHDGFALSGHDFQVTATSAVQSGRYGYMVMGQRTLLGMPAAGITSQGSGDAGVNLDGMSLSVTNCVVTGAKDGMQLHGMDVTIDGCVATDNAETGISGAGINWHLRNNQAARNGHDGLVVRGAAIADEGGNRGSGNGGPRSHRPAVQCMINGVPCGQ